jgi:hypothetical protein
MRNRKEMLSYGFWFKNPFIFRKKNTCSQQRKTTTQKKENKQNTQRPLRRLFISRKEKDRPSIYRWRSWQRRLQYFQLILTFIISSRRNSRQSFTRENPMIGERKVITKITWVLLTRSEYNKKRYTLWEINFEKKTVTAELWTMALR